MKVKLLIPIIIVCVALAAMVILKRTNEPTVTLQEQTNLVPLVDESIDLTQVTRLEFFAGVSPHQRVVMVLEDGNWIMQSYYNAPVLPSRPNLIISSLADFKGEFRATATEEQLADYDLSNNRAFHIRGVNNDSNTEIFHVLGGKTIKSTNLLMRNANSNNVYLINHNLRLGAFLGTDDYDELPSPSPWLDKAIVVEPDAEFTKFELTMPDKPMVFEKQTVDGDIKWTVTQGGLEEELQSEVIDTLSSRLKNLIAFQIVSPNKKEIWGLDKPEYRLIAHRENGEPIELVVSHPSPSGPAYLQRIDNDNQQYYAFTVNKFFGLFPKGQSIYSLPKVQLDAAPIKTIAYSTPDESIELNWIDDEWVLKGAEKDEKPIQSKVQRMAKALASWEATDFAAYDTDSGLSSPQYSVVFSTKSEKYSIKLGNESLHIKGRYAQLDDHQYILAMDNKDIDKIFLSKEDLLNENTVAPTPPNTSIPNLGQALKAHGPGDGHNHPH